MNPLSSDHSSLPEDNPPTIMENVQDKAQEVLNIGRIYARENPTLLAVAALCVGVGIGAFCRRREFKSNHTDQTVRDMMEDIISQVSDRFRKQADSSSSIVGRCRNISKKWKWW